MAFWSDTNTPEPLRSHRWYIRFTANLRSVIFALKECKKPEYEVTITEHRRLNNYIKLPGLVKWKPINIKFASIRESKAILDDAASRISNILFSGGYTLPSDTFLKNVISKDKMISAIGNDLELIQVDADGKDIETWKLHNPIMTSTNFGTLSYENEEIVNIECTINYDWASLTVGKETEEAKAASFTAQTGSNINQQDLQKKEANVSFTGVVSGSAGLLKNKISDPNNDNNISNKIVLPARDNPNPSKRRFTQRDLNDRNLFQTLMNFNDYLNRSEQAALAAQEAAEIRAANRTDAEISEAAKKQEDAVKEQERRVQEAAAKIEAEQQYMQNKAERDRLSANLKGNPPPSDEPPPRRGSEPPPGGAADAFRQQMNQANVSSTGLVGAIGPDGVKTSTLADTSNLKGGVSPESGIIGTSRGGGIGSAPESPDSDRLTLTPEQVKNR